MKPIAQYTGFRAGAVLAASIVLSPDAFAMGHLFSKDLVVPVHAINAAGIGEDIGTLTLSEKAGELVIKPNLRSLPPGDHGFHIHAKADCGPALKDGAMAAGVAAGGHFDPSNTGKHDGPMGAGHEGDMPVLTVAADGTATTEVTVPRMTLAKARGHAIIIHEGGDNYSDAPKPLGGGGNRIACATVM